MIDFLASPTLNQIFTAGGVSWKWDGVKWIAQGAGQKFELEVASSDETTAITTGVAKITFYMPAAVTLAEVFTGLSGQSSSGIVTADVKKAGATIFSTLFSIGAS